MSGFLMLGYQKSSPGHPPTLKTPASIVGLMRANTYVASSEPSNKKHTRHNPQL